MKRAIFAFALAALVGALTVPASADVFVLAIITKDKDVTVHERVDVLKTINITANVPTTPVGAAEATAVANQRVTNNVVAPAVENLAAGVSGVNINILDERIIKSAIVTGSINSNAGIVGVNQDAGNISNQGNVVATAVSLSPSSAANAEASAEQQNFRNNSVHRELVLRTLNLDAEINGSITGDTGIVGVNQNVGNMNNQVNMVAMAVGLGSLFALSEADLGQFNSNNTVSEIAVVKSASISGSINGNTGVVGVNQTVGNMANQANVVSVAAALNR